MNVGIESFRIERFDGNILAVVSAINRRDARRYFLSVPSTLLRGGLREDPTERPRLERRLASPWSYVCLGIFMRRATKRCTR